MIYHFKIHKEGNSYWAECIELEGCRTQGDSLDELKINMEDALNLFLSEPSESKTFFPAPNKALKGRNIIDVHVAPSVAFATFMRRTRLLKKMTIEQFKNCLDIKNVSVYQKLEDPKRANPELKTLSKIKEAFPDINFDEVI